MAYNPKPANPRNLRELWYAVWHELTEIGKIVDGGGGTNDHTELINVTPDQHHSQAHLLYGPDHTDVDTSLVLSEGNILGYDNSLPKFAAQYRLNWIADYIFGPVYPPMTMVNLLGSEYLAISNAPTADYAFPAEVGALLSLYPDTPPFTESSNVSLVQSGYRLVFAVPGEVRRLEVWVPEVIADTHYSLVIIKDPDGASPTATRTLLANADLAANQWNIVTTGAKLYTAGSEVLVYIESQNFASSVLVTGDWTYNGRSQGGSPATAGWNTDNQSDTLRIDATDDLGADRTADLLTITVGSTVTMTATASPTDYFEYAVTRAPVVSGSAVTMDVSLVQSGGTVATGALCGMVADIPVTASTKYNQEAGKFTPQPAYATFTAHLQFGDIDQSPPADMGYGINFDFQELTQSPDWDIILLGSSGGGGESDFVPEIFKGIGTQGYVPDPGSGEGATDPFFGSVVLLWHGDKVGSNGNPTLPEIGDSGTAWVNGSDLFTSAGAKFGGGCALSNGVDYISQVGAVDQGITTDNGHCLEFWFRNDSHTSPRMALSLRGTGLSSEAGCVVDVSGELIVVCGDLYPASFIYTGVIITTGVWYHLAIQQVDNGSDIDLTVYLDGKLIYTEIGRLLGFHISAAALWLCGPGQSGTFNVDPWHGAVDEVRVSFKTFRYTGEFTRPAEPFYDGSGPAIPGSRVLVDTGEWLPDTNIPAIADLESRVAALEGP